MEDAHMVCTSIPVEGQDKHLSEGHALFGVMDGHGGDFTSGFASQNFMNVFSKNGSLQKYAAMTPEEQSDVPGIQLLRSVLSETFSDLDSEIRKKQNKRNDTVLQMTEKMGKENATAGIANNAQARPKFERSGSTCVVILVTPSHIICANAGDSRAVLQRGDTVLPLSFDHKPNNIPEHERITKAGGFVKSKRVDGDLAVSRGLGDFSYKTNEGFSTDKQKVIPNPEFVVYPRNRKEDEYIILACDGIWDVATNQQCSQYVQELLKEGETDLGLICEEALDVCLEKNSRDNMTLGLVSFEGIKMAKGITNQRNVVWQRRTTRQALQFEQSAKAAATRAAAGVGLKLNIDTNSSIMGGSTNKRTSALPVTPGSK